MASFSAATPDHEQSCAERCERRPPCPALSIASAKELAGRMAGMTRIIRDLIAGTLRARESSGAGCTTGWPPSAKRSSPTSTRSSSPTCSRRRWPTGCSPRGSTPPPGKPFSRELAAYNLPKTNPFLRKLFAEIAGVNMPDSIAWAVDDIVELLKHADMAEILTDFGKGKGKEDPVVHFYETFLAAYDPKMREVRGVYYTPEPVVSYIVRSIDHLLKTRFNRPKGLADENTLILDPATGTATFLYFVIEQIRQKFARQAGAWDDYVAKHLLNRVFGFELLMAPYAVAHLKLGMQLQETGYQFGSDQRLGIYLTNTLEEAAREERAVAATPRQTSPRQADPRGARQSAVLAASSANRGEWITRLRGRLSSSWTAGTAGREEEVAARRLRQVPPLWPVADRAHRPGRAGVSSPITAIWTARRFAACAELCRSRSTRSTSSICTATPNAARRRPTAAQDENVFDITQGVAIALFVKHGQEGRPRRPLRRCVGRPARQNTKCSAPATSVRRPWRQLVPAAPFYEFAPVDRQARDEYDEGWRVTDIFPVGSNGVQTSRDRLVVDFQEDVLLDRIEQFLAPGVSDAEVRARFFAAKSVGNYPPGDTRGWKLGEARLALRQDRQWRRAVDAASIVRSTRVAALSWRDGGLAADGRDASFASAEPCTLRRPCGTRCQRSMGPGFLLPADLRPQSVLSRQQRQFSPLPLCQQ